MSDDALPVINIDELQHNRDWLRRRWGTLPGNPHDLYRLLRVLWMSVEQFKQTTVYQCNVESMPWLRDLADDEKALVPWPSGPIDPEDEAAWDRAWAKVRAEGRPSDPCSPISAYGQQKYAAYVAAQEELAKIEQRATREREKVRRHNAARLARRCQEGKE